MSVNEALPYHQTGALFRSADCFVLASHGEGWGLLQVLAGMRGTGAGAAREFGESAAAVLARRVRNAPPERGEGRWLAGWEKRVRAYGE